MSGLQLSDPRVRRAALLLAVLACTALRLIHLEADTPVNVGGGSMGLYIDEGYKTLAARNTVLFGAPQWHPEDRYIGWHRVSGLTHWPYVAAFQLFGVELGSARLVTIGYFLLLVLSYAFVGTRGTSTWVLLAGTLLLSLSYVLFFFSRVALLEIPVAALVYVTLFGLRATRLERSSLSLALITTAAALGTFQIKRSAILYFLPLFAGFLIATVVDGRHRRRVLTVWAPTALALLAFLAYWLRPAWAWRFELSPADALRQVLVNPLTWPASPGAPSSVLLVSLGLVCGLHLLASRPRQTLGDPYACGLIAMATLGPILLALFPYNPLRYYVPIVPAYVLLFLEWLSLAPWRWTRTEESSALRHAGLPLLVWTLFVVGLAVNGLVLHRLPLPIGDTPGISVTVFYRLLLPVALLLALPAWRYRGRFLPRRAFIVAVATLAIATTARDLWVVGRFLAAPSYHSREISASLERIVGPEDSIGGDLVPFFALGTQMHALLVAPHANSPAENPSLELDYFQFSETNEGRETRRLLAERDVRLGPSLHESSYAGRSVSLHRLHYAD